MKIQNHPPVSGHRPLPQPPAPEGPKEPKETVTFNKETNSYEYHGPYGTHSEKKLSVLGETLKGAVLAGVPAALGLGERALLGPAVGTLTILPNAGIGAMVGIGAGAVHGYREAMEGRPDQPGLSVEGMPRAALYGFFGGIGGAIGGAVLPLAGLYGGAAGALAITGGFAGLGAYFAVKHNNELHRKAVEHGFQG